MVNIKRYDHSYTLNYDGMEKELFSGQDINKMIEIYFKHGDAYMAVQGRNVLAICGIYPLYQGVGNGWAFINKDARKHFKSIYKAIRDGYKNIVKDYGFHRVQTAVIKDCPKALKLIERLGFTAEGVMKQCGFNKEDMVLYARLEA